jgi:hypothetical protein
VNVFGCSAFCGHVDDADQPSSVPFHQMGSRFIKNVWSELELESSTFGSSVGTSMDSSDNDSGESRQGSYISCQEPLETGSNIPVLRQLPSFGSNLASNSLESEIYRSSTGLRSYPTRQSSMDSTSHRKFSIPPLFGSSDDEHLEVRNVKEVAVSPLNTTDSFIFLRQ